MKDSIFSKNTDKMAELIKKQKAKIQLKENKFISDFMKETDTKTISQIFDIVEKSGHPNEINQIKEIRLKYEKGNELEFDDIISLNDLYLSNIEQFKNNKGDNYE